MTFEIHGFSRFALKLNSQDEHVAVHTYFFTRSKKNAWKAVDAEYEAKFPNIIKQARAFRSAAFAQYAHMVVGQKCESTSSWDHNEIVKSKHFNDSMSFFLGSTTQVNKVWLQVFKMIESGQLVRDWTVVTVNGAEKRKAVFAVRNNAALTLLFFFPHFKVGRGLKFTFENDDCRSRPTRMRYPLPATWRLKP